MSLPARLQLTVLIDNTVYMPSLRAEHGLSILAESAGVRVLLDTGQTGQIIQNAHMLQVDLASVSHVALSHGHYDHSGGLESVLGKASSARLHAHPAAFQEKYKHKGDGEFRYIGCPLQMADMQLRCSEAVLDHAPHQLPAGFGLTGEVPRRHGWEETDHGFFVDCDGQRVRDPLVDDQSLYWDGPTGPVVICGCAHAGVVNTLEHVAELTGRTRIHAVVGGFHLTGASDDRIDKTIEAFRRLGVERVGVGHCTGQRASRRLFDAFGDKCFLCSVGTRASFGE